MSTRRGVRNELPESPLPRPQNALLAALPSAELQRLAPLFSLQTLGQRQVLYRPGEPMEHVYFPADGLCSIALTMEDGRTVEVATVGREGMIGPTDCLGAESMPGEVIVRIPGAYAYVMPVDLFVREIGRCRPLRELVSRYSQAFVASLMQSAACNGLHAADQRCARWLLQSQDRLGRDWFELTQEFLAFMLGVRRATVSMIAQELQRAGLITFRRGGVTILDRAGLEKLSCECYGAIKAHFARLVAP